MKLQQHAVFILGWHVCFFLAALLCLASGSHWGLALTLFAIGAMLALQGYSYWVVFTQMPEFRTLPLRLQFELLYCQQPAIPLFQTCKIIPAQPITNPQSRDYQERLLNLGFVKDHSVTVIGSPGPLTTRFTHPTLNFAASIALTPHIFDKPSLYISFIQPDGTRVSIGGPARKEFIIPVDLPGFLSIDLVDATFDSIMERYHQTALPGHHPSKTDESLRFAEHLNYQTLKQWRDHNFQFTNAYAPLFASMSQLSKDAIIALYRESWANIHVGLLLRHRHLTGQPERLLTQKEIDHHIPAHADQTCDEFFILLIKKLDQRPSASHVRFADAVNAARKTLPRTSNGLEACEYLLAQNPNSPLQLIARFDHPVQAILLKIS